MQSIVLDVDYLVVQLAVHAFSCHDTPLNLFAQAKDRQPSTTLGWLESVLGFLACSCFPRSCSFLVLL